MDMKLEVVVVPVSDVDRAKAFYEKLGWRLDIDYAAPDGGYRVIQFTPPGSHTSIIFGSGVTAARAGSMDRMVLAVSDIDIACRDLNANGVEAEIFHDPAGGLGGGFYADASKRDPGPDPQRRSYASYASFSDPDGNRWLLQEIKERLPGRERKSTGSEAADTTTLAQLLRETEEHHGPYEKSHSSHHWWDWYAPYLSTRQNGGTPEQAAAAADLYMEQVLIASSPATAG